MRVRWTERATADLEAIFECVARDNPAAARRLVKQIRAQVPRLHRHPYAGRMLPELGDPETRELILRPYRIIHTLAQDVRILAVHHGRRAL